MKLRKLKQIIDTVSEAELESEVAVKIYGIYATEPRVPIKSAYLGFDWSHGIFVLVPERELEPKQKENKP